MAILAYRVYHISKCIILLFSKYLSWYLFTHFMHDFNQAP